MSVWFKSRLNPWYIWIPSNPNLHSTKIIMKMRWQTIASNVSIRTISPTATPLPKAYDCVAVYIAGRRTSLVVYGWWPQPPTKNVTGIPGAWATRKYMYRARGPWHCKGWTKIYIWATCWLCSVIYLRIRDVFQHMICMFTMCVLDIF